MRVQSVRLLIGARNYGTDALHEHQCEISSIIRLSIVGSGEVV